MHPQTILQKKQIYDCARCYMRPEAAEQLRLIRDELKEKYGYGIRIFDCYRPGPYQQRLWDIVPDPNYVTPPNKGSMHSRGLAIDLTLTDKSGRDLDMGTPFDFFRQRSASWICGSHRYRQKAPMDTTQHHGKIWIRIHPYRMVALQL
jgi:D-alanyl-D-alanine dipeptidase